MEPTQLITNLLSVGLPDKGLTKTVSESYIDFLAIVAKARELLLSQPPMVELDSPIHMDSTQTYYEYSTRREMELQNQMKDTKGGFPPLSNYLFLGDYVDRGKQNLEVILLVLAYKLRYPKNFFILRGNHECANVNRTYGFYDECMRRYQSQRMWQSFQDTFCVLPLTALVGDKILCMHGGLSPHLESLDQLRTLPRPTDATGNTLEMDLLWADPVIGLSGFQVGNTRVKLRYPKNFFILRGNHECANVNRTYGFYDECMRRYQSQRMWQSFQVEQPTDATGNTLEMDLLWADPVIGLSGFQVGNTRVKVHRF
ncbi:unnamed protein product [Strongylus vulgaris]|uniref:Serine/threonine-protein phosphatase n=1 Tax=Strongylus vulgaris TaxID=40348 RepID=A0A3P7JTX8_STRVU|nr:unnamed protein product [Strongylus vulgaris]